MHVEQGQFSSIGRKSILYCDFFNINSPGWSNTSAVPNLAVLVGKTQSNMSLPIATHAIISTFRSTKWCLIIKFCVYGRLILFSSMVSKPINIHWIRTSFQRYWKIMNSILLQTIFHEYKNKTGINLIIFHFNIRGF